MAEWRASEQPSTACAALGESPVGCDEFGIELLGKGDKRRIVDCQIVRDRDHSGALRESVRRRQRKPEIKEFAGCRVQIGGVEPTKPERVEHFKQKKRRRAESHVARQVRLE